MEHWLMIHNFVALNTSYKKTVPDKKTTFRSPKGTDKQLDYVLTDRQQKNLRYSRDAEAFDMEHMARDRRCVMAHFVFPAETKNCSQIKHTKEKNNSKISIEAAAAATTKNMKGP